MRMKYLIFLFVFLALVAWSSFGFCTTYYVKNDGNDSYSGLSDAEAWKTIRKVNSFSFSDGDTVCFKRGDTFSDASLTKKDVNNFTIRDYGEGTKPFFNSDINYPIRIMDVTSMSNLTIMNINISGQDWSTNKSTNLYVRGVNGLTIDGIIGDGHYGGNAEGQIGKTAIGIEYCSGNIIIKNCELFNWGPVTIPTPGVDLMGIYIGYQTSGTYEIYNNTVYNINADCLQNLECTATGSIYDNTFYNAGENGIDNKGSSNVKIYNNTFYRTEDFVGYGGNSLSSVSLIDVHEGYVSNSANIKIYDNLFDGGSSPGIFISRCSDVEIDHNKYIDLARNIKIGNPSTNILIHHNNIINPVTYIDDTSNNCDLGGIYENNSGTGVKIYNNTIYNATGTTTQLISINSSNDSEIFYNVVYQGLAGSDSYALYTNPNGTGPNVHDNGWYSSGTYVTKYRSTGSFTMTDDVLWEAAHDNDQLEDPLFKDAADGNLSLSASSTFYDSDNSAWGALGGELETTSEEGTISIPPAPGSLRIVE